MSTAQLKAFLCAMGYVSKCDLAATEPVFSCCLASLRVEFYPASALWLSLRIVWSFTLHLPRGSP